MQCLHGGTGTMLLKRRVVYLYQRLKVTDHSHKN